MSKKNYMENIDEAEFHSWLRSRGWTEDTSPETERWTVPAWFNERRGVTKREDWLADDYEDFLYETRNTKT